jgi:hypothetical protein
LPRLTDTRRLTPLLLLPTALAAQGGDRGLEFHVGRWYHGNRATAYELRTSAPLGAVFTHGFGATVLVHDSLGRHRAFYGLSYELQAWRGRAPLGPYALAGLGLGLSSDTTQALAALWSVGGGLEWRPVGWLAVGTELRYRLEDRGPRGFWRAVPGAPAGLTLALGVTLGGGSRGGGGGGPGGPRLRGRGAGEPLAAPPLPPEPPAALTGNGPDVVQTALESLGTPYVWGGTADNGFDCSGLIQYAYAQHGIRLPRRSRDQAHVGAEVTPVVAALRPGDILLFAAHPWAGVTHVGMYVGETKFIHSATQGVKLSRLDPADPEGGYWLDRWVGARRIIP